MFGAIRKPLYLHGPQLPGSSEEATARTRAACDKAIAAHQNFNLKVKRRTAGIARSGSARGSISGPATSTLQLQFRSANSSTIDSFMPQVAVPATMGSAPPAEGDPTYYYATIVTTTPAAGAVPVPPSPSAAAAAAATVRRTSASISGSNIDSGANSCGSLGVFTLVDDNAAAFEDVTLGPMLGYGSYGRVYRGEAGGAKCTVVSTGLLRGRGCAAAPWVANAAWLHVGPIACCIYTRPTVLLLLHCRRRVERHHDRGQGPGASGGGGRRSIAGGAALCADIAPQRGESGFESANYCPPSHNIAPKFGESGYYRA